MSFEKAAESRVNTRTDASGILKSTLSQPDATERTWKLRRVLILLVTVSVWTFCFWVTKEDRQRVHVDVVGEDPLEPQESKCGGGERILSDKDDFDWAAVKPSPTLNWTSCYEKYQCARLEVPLDYSDEDGEKAAVAVIKKPSKFAPGEEGYRGPILYNPGGPGGSGVMRMLTGWGEKFHTIIGDDYDIVGFDPRGVGFTTPSLSLFPDVFHAFAYALHELPLLNASSDSLGRRWANSHAFGQLVQDRAEKAAAHVSTPVVVRDMLSIVRAHGREKLQYWGFSYGTVLGATFAAMFPDNVERLIIDGVVDSEDYYKTLWFNNLRDADKSELAIYESCVAAGPEKCPLYENSTTAILARVDKIMHTLRRTPLSVVISKGELEIIDADFAEHAIFRNLYAPHAKGRELLDALAALEGGDPYPVYNLTSPWADLADFSCECGGKTKFPFGRMDGAHLAIACSDGDAVGDTMDELESFYDELATTSRWAKTWTLRLGCSGWKVRAKEQFKGTFKQNTSFPLLLIGNTADPVTPVWNAHKMSEGFNGSVVLTQDSPGHCSVAAASLCTAKVVRHYFRDGVLPAPGTVCDVQTSIFGDSPLAGAQAMGMTDEDLPLLQASYELSQSGSVPLLGHVH